jgi:hypothetical protein
MYCLLVSVFPRPASTPGTTPAQCRVVLLDAPPDFVSAVDDRTRAVARHERSVCARDHEVQFIVCVAKPHAPSDFVSQTSAADTYLALSPPG